MPITRTCPVCNADGQLYIAGDDSLSLASVGSSRTKLSPGRILKCTQCGLAFRSFRPNVAELAQLYRDADDSLYEAELSNRFKTAHRHHRIIQRFVSRPGVLIDVGCASGAFLRVMADGGWTVIGVEPSRSQSVRAARVLDGRGEIRQETLENAELPSQVDLVTLWDVLEHVVDPVAFLTRCSNRLKLGGLLVLNVPRIDSFIAKRLGLKWPLLLAEHLNYFTMESLRVCTGKANLDILKTGTRPVSFSLGYILFRLSQHGLPGSNAISRPSNNSRLGSLSIPIWMGEMYVVCRRK